MPDDAQNQGAAPAAAPEGGWLRSGADLWKSANDTFTGGTATWVFDQIENHSGSIGSVVSSYSPAAGSLVASIPELRAAVNVLGSGVAVAAAYSEGNLMSPEGIENSANIAAQAGKVTGFEGVEKTATLFTDSVGLLVETDREGLSKGNAAELAENAIKYEGGDLTAKATNIYDGIKALKENYDSSPRAQEWGSYFAAKAYEAAASVKSTVTAGSRTVGEYLFGGGEEISVEGEDLAPGAELDLPDQGLDLSGETEQTNEQAAGIEVSVDSDTTSPRVSV